MEGLCYCTDMAWHEVVHKIKGQPSQVKPDRQPGPFLLTGILSVPVPPRLSKMYRLLMDILYPICTWVSSSDRGHLDMPLKNLASQAYARLPTYSTCAALSRL